MKETENKNTGITPTAVEAEIQKKEIKEEKKVVMKNYDDLTKAVFAVEESSIPGKEDIIDLLNEALVMRNLYGADKDAQKAIKGYKIVKVAFKEGNSITRAVGIYNPDSLKEEEAEDILISGEKSPKVITLPNTSECLSSFK
ncbi:MAG: hypothetical protein PHY15_06795 [Eubacteriales bacterium]|nr:hypothetical protein [Eubacteriales bacterium]